jgi:hypothetical protein
VNFLWRKYIKAQSDFAEAKREHESLTATVSPTLLVEWTKAEEYAMNNRLHDVKVMDIYDVQKEKGPLLQPNIYLFGPYSTCSARSFPIPA